MQAQQLIKKAGLTPDERQVMSRMNKVRVLTDQADLCARTCFAKSIGLEQQKNGTY